MEIQNERLDVTEHDTDEYEKVVQRITISKYVSGSMHVSENRYDEAGEQLGGSAETVNDRDSLFDHLREVLDEG